MTLVSEGHLPSTVIFVALALLMLLCGMELNDAYSWRSFNVHREYSYSMRLPIGNPSSNNLPHHSQIYSRKSCRLSMESVGVGGGTGQLPRAPGKSFIISPSSKSGGDEMMILDNFDQIQLGERKKIGIIGTKKLSDGHQQMVELLSYALVLSGNHVYTSGGGNGTNLAVIRGALRACNPDLLTVILPQSLTKQPDEMQPLLGRVANLVEQPENDHLELKDAANQCNMRIIRSVDRLVAFAYRGSKTVLTSVLEVEASEVMDVIKFYLD